MEFKVMSYNIQSGRNYGSVLTRCFDWQIEVIKNASPDIVGLQEVGRHPSAGFPLYEMEDEPTEYIAKELNMYSYFAKAILVEGKYPYGNAILSKYPIKNAKTVMIPDPVKRQKNGAYETRCVLVAEIDVLGGITVIVSHFGLMEEEKVNAVQTVLNLVKEIKTPILFMGDLNMKPNDEILQPIFKVLKDTAYGALTPITWPSDVDKATGKGRRGPQEEVRKIDYIFASEHFKTKKEETLQSKASDHLPYVVHFEM
jgi:endonuclease/exonuclease/phosphatase family metal-dependent hydrolase